MSYPLGPMAALDSYAPQTTLETQECARIDFFVSNGPIFYELQREGRWDGEKYIPSAQGQTYFVSLDRVFTGVRIRNAIAGVVATVVVDAIPQSELPGGAGFSAG